tara:strand:+ start:469 stop:828 length:360 start_codon:yes stop_codon:yes gene_type:complete
MKHLLNWLIVIAWMAVIYTFSNQPDLHSGFEPIYDLVLRKMAHMTEYFVLAFLVHRAVSQSDVPPGKSVVLATVFAIAYAFSDEYHQNFVVGRHGSYPDVGIDSIGVLAWVWLNSKLRS